MIEPSTPTEERETSIWAASVERVLSSDNSQTLLRAMEELALDVVLLTDLLHGGWHTTRLQIF